MSGPVSSEQEKVPSSGTLLQEQIEDLKRQYGATKLDEYAGREIELAPSAAPQSFNATEDARSLLTRIASAYGISTTFDDSTPSRRVHFELKNVDFETAMDLAAQMTRTFWVPVAPDKVLIAADNTQKRRELERMLQKTFYLPDTTTPTELNDVVNALRTLLEIRYVNQQPATSSITVRAPQRTLHAAEALLESMSLARPQVVLDIQAFEVNHSMLRTVGLDLPLQFQIFNIGSSALALLNSPNIQSLIAQLIASGGLNAANTGSIAALLAQLQNQQNSLLSNPVATFGGGLTLFGIGVPPATANLSLNESQVTTLEQATVRASQGNAATVHVGTRYPVLTQSFSSGFNLPGQNLNIIGAVPGFTYQDLGLTLKAKPLIHSTTDVTLDLELAVRSLGSQSFNGVPVIQSRDYKGVIRVRDGETAVMAGILSNTEQKSVRGIPVVGYLPILNRLTTNESKNNTQTELVVVITPHIVRSREGVSQAIAVPPQ
jgi:type II secretory pathway component GspD/PulD (secretin)